MEWILVQEGFLIYIVLFCALVGGAFGLPIPEDLPLIAAGILVHKGSAHPWITGIVCYFAIVVGDLIIFTFGWMLGPKLFRSKWFRRKISHGRIKKMRVGLEQRSLLMIFLARHLFYLRTVTFLTCGAVRMKPSRFILADMAAALISVPLMLYLGFVAALHYKTVMSWIHRFEQASMALGAVLLFAFTYYLLKKRKERANEKPLSPKESQDPEKLEANEVTKKAEG